MDEFFTTACAVRPQSLMTGFVTVGRDLVDFGKHSRANAIQCNWLQLTEQPPVRLVDDTRHEMTCPPGALTAGCSGAGWPLEPHESFSTLILDRSPFQKRSPVTEHSLSRRSS